MELVGSEDALERGLVRELTANIATVTLYAAKEIDRGTSGRRIPLA